MGALTATRRLLTHPLQSTLCSLLYFLPGVRRRRPLLGGVGLATLALSRFPELSIVDLRRRFGRICRRSASAKQQRCGRHEVEHLLAAGLVSASVVAIGFGRKEGLQTSKVTLRNAIELFMKSLK